MKRLTALGVLGHVQQAGELDLPPCPCPAEDGSPAVDLAPEFCVALAELTGRLPNCHTLAELMDAVTEGGNAYQAGDVTTEALEGAMGAVMDEVWRWGRGVGGELN